MLLKENVINHSHKLKKNEGKLRCNKSSLSLTPFDIDATLSFNVDDITNSQAKTTKQSKIILDENFTPTSNTHHEVSINTINPELLITPSIDVDSNETATTTCNDVIHFSLISKKTIAIECEQQQSTTIPDALKRIITSNGGVYESNLKLYIAPIHNYPTLYKLIKQLKHHHYMLKPIPSFAIKAIQSEEFNKIIFTFKNKEIIFDYINDPIKTVNDVPSKLYNALYEYQKEGIQFGIQRHGRILIADEMGIGKTIQTIGLCYIYKNDWPVIIICPGSLKYNWSNEIKKWLTLSSNDVWIINASKDKIPNNKQVYIISYDLVHAVRKRLRKLKSNVMILDECHNIKNVTTRRACCIVPLAQRSKRLMLLSGTPILSHTKEAFTLLECLRPDIFDDYNEYKVRYCCDKNETKKRRNYGVSYTKELNCIFNSLMIRRLKKSVLCELPLKKRTKIEIECEGEIVKMIKEKKNEQGKTLCMGEAYKLTGLSKIKGVKMYVMNLLLNEQKFILFAHHRTVLDALEEFLQKKHIGYIRIDGDTDIQKRFKLVEQFQTSKQCLVALLSINATATGITLTSAAMVVFAELSWTPAIMIQAEDRAHRIGQKNDTVDVRYLYGRDTLDEYIFRKLSEKMTIVSTTLDNVEADMGLKDNTAHKDKDKEKDSNESELNEDLETVSTEVDLNDVNAHEHSMKRKLQRVYDEKEDEDDDNDKDYVIRSKRYVL